MTKLIYVVEAQNGAIKIGVSVAPDKRVAAINTHSPCPCRLIAMWPGDQSDERKLHQRFEPYRSHCEWFFQTVEVAQFVAKVRGTGLERIQDWAEITSASREARHLLAAQRRSASLKAAWADPSRAYSRSRRAQLPRQHAAAGAVRQ